MPRLGIVDLGSNTSRLVVFEHEPGRWFRQVDEIREAVRLGEGLARSGRLGRRAMQRALAALALYADYARAARLRVEVLATSAVRDAANGRDFLRDARALGFDLEVLDGEAEARLGALAVANGFAFADAWVVDLGGGSLQLSRLAERTFVEGEAHPLGAVRLTEAFLTGDPPGASEVARLERHVDDQLGPWLSVLRTDDVPLVGMGGSLRNLARAVQRAEAYPLDVVHGYFLAAESLERLTKRLLRLDSRARARVKGLKPDRADVVLAAAVVFRHLLRRSERDGIWISGQGLREGAFYRRFLRPPHLIDDPRRFAVQNLFAQSRQPVGHTERVRRLARQLFCALRPLHDFDGADGELLDAAATLHDVGTPLGYHEHHRHGEYLLTRGPLPGFTHREQALVALLVRFHRKGTPRAETLAPLLAPGDGVRLRHLTACLRLAESLERSRAGRIRGLEVAIGPRRVTISLVADEEPWVELWEAGKQLDLLRAAFARDVRLDVA